MFIVILYVKSNFLFLNDVNTIMHFIKKENQINSQLMRFIEKENQINSQLMYYIERYD